MNFNFITFFFSISVFSVMQHLVHGEGSTEPTGNFEWGPKLQLGKDGSIKMAKLEINSGSNLGLRVHGRSEINGDVTMNGKVKFTNDLVVDQNARTTVLDVEEINIGRFRMLIENSNLLIFRDTLAKTDKRYVFFPDKSVNL